MILFTKPILAKLLENGRLQAAYDEDSGEPYPDFHPVVKLFTPWANCTWLLTEIDPDEPDIAFGLCDLGMGCPELGSVRLSEITGVTGPAGLRIERDRHFTADKPLSAYADEARKAQRIKA